MPVIFVLGVVAIALEDKIKVNKSALLWTGGNITAWHQISHLFLPAVANLLVPLIIADFWLFKKGTKLRQSSNLSAADIYIERIPNRSRIIIFWIGISSLAFVPVFQTITHLPAFMCVLIGLVFLWIYTDLMYGRINDIRESDKLRIPTLSRSVDLPTIFFFFGILMSLAAMNVGGQLSLFADVLSSNIKEPYAISIISGAISSVVDNVALVAATMGLEKISFGYFFKRFTPLAVLGYIAGILMFLAME